MAQMTFQQFREAINKMTVRNDAKVVFQGNILTKALKAAGQSDKVEEYRTKATSGDYNNLLRVSMEYVTFASDDDIEDEDDYDVDFDEE